MLALRVMKSEFFPHAHPDAAVNTMVNTYQTLRAHMNTCQTLRECVPVRRGPRRLRPAACQSAQQPATTLGADMTSTTAFGLLALTQLTLRALALPAPSDTVCMGLRLLSCARAHTQQ
jgi:hypothetical protein